MIKNYKDYAQKKQRAKKTKQIIKKFLQMLLFACVFCIFGYLQGFNKGFLQGIEQMQQCTEAGSGFYIDKTGFKCIFD